MGLNKRGEEASKNELVYIFVIVVALLLFLAWQMDVFERGSLAAEEEHCRQTITMHSRLVRSTGEHAAPPIECAPDERVIDNRDPEKAKRQVADALVFCWERWQEGEIQLFNEEGTFCNPCSIVTFRKADGEFRGVTAYMENAKVNGVTYADFLYPFESELYGEEKDMTHPELAFDTSETYAIVFYHDKNHSTRGLWEAVTEDPLKLTNAMREAGTGATVGALVVGVPVLVIGGVCTFISGGICAPVTATGTLAATGIGSTIGAAVGGGKSVMDGLTYPEWFSMIFVIPHESEAYKALGCEAVFQQGRPDMVGTAEDL